MANIILQHFTGMPDTVVNASLASIAAYAAQIGAEHRLLSGPVFRDGLSDPMQKLALLNEEFDGYDTVVMLDTDVFMRAGLTESIFDFPGIGVSGPAQKRLKWAYIRKMKGLLHWRYPYWCGSLWKLDSDLRQRFRAKLPKVDLMKYTDGRLEDEGVMHQLARHCSITDGYMPGGMRWSCPNYDPGIDNAALIHIRPRAVYRGPTRPKAEMLQDMMERGLIAP
jgi:hypothetical protein